MRHDKTSKMSVRRAKTEISMGFRSESLVCAHWVTIEPSFFSFGQRQLSFLMMHMNIRIHHECEYGIEKSVLRFTDWHHEACRVMPNGDCEGRIFLFHPHTKNGFFFLLTTNNLIFIEKN